MSLAFGALAPASAQDASERYATGLILEDEATHRSFPQSPTYRAFLPESVDLSGRMPEVGDQGQQGSCVGWAVGYAARSYYRLASEGQQLDTTDNIASPAYVFDAIRGNGCDRGSRIPDALTLLQSGALSASRYPYDDKQCRTLSSADRAEATGFRTDGFLTIDVTKLDQVRGALAKGHPVIVGAMVDDAFQALRRGRTWNSTGEPQAGDGGHAITIVGYNDRRKHFKFINSWGRDWGTRGYGTMTYDTFAARVYFAYRIVPLSEPVNPVVDPPAPPPEPQPDPQPITPDPPAPPVPTVVLPRFECSRLQLSSDQRTISGFVGSAEDVATLERDFGGRFAIDVRLRPWPQCEALMIVSNPVGQLKDRSRVPSIATDRRRYVEGDTLPISVQTPGFSTHLHLAYFQADGSVVNLVQSSAANLVTIPPSSTLRFGDGAEGRDRFRITGPFGPEMILAVTTRSPLFRTERPLVETEREFLSALRAATIDMRANGVKRFYSADDYPLETASKGVPEWQPDIYGP